MYGLWCCKKNKIIMKNTLQTDISNEILDYGWKKRN